MKAVQTERIFFFIYLKIIFIIMIMDQLTCYFNQIHPPNIHTRRFLHLQTKGTQTEKGNPKWLPALPLQYTWMIQHCLAAGCLTSGQSQEACLPVLPSLPFLHWNNLPLSTTLVNGSSILKHKIHIITLIIDLSTTALLLYYYTRLTSFFTMLVTEF